jgi:hypothetical protein
MSSLGALSQAWVTAEASLPLGWRLTGVMMFGDEWIAFSNGDTLDDRPEASGAHAAQALTRLAEALRERARPSVGSRSA